MFVSIVQESWGFAKRSYQASAFCGLYSSYSLKESTENKLVNSSKNVEVRCIKLRAIPSYPKTAIFPETREGNVNKFNESARGWSLRGANVKWAPRAHRMMGKTQ